jgi:uncharacterized membrane protein YjdF
MLELEHIIAYYVHIYISYRKSRPFQKVNHLAQGHVVFAVSMTIRCDVLQGHIMVVFLLATVGLGLTQILWFAHKQDTVKTCKKQKQSPPKKHKETT